MIWNKRMKDLREDADLTQSQMGQICNLGQNAISKYEAAERSVPIEIIIKYSNFFKVSTDYILGQTDKK